MSIDGGSLYTPNTIIKPTLTYIPNITFTGGAGTVSSLAAGSYTVLGGKLVFISIVVGFTITSSLGGTVQVSLPTTSNLNTPNLGAGFTSGFESFSNKGISGRLQGGNNLMAIWFTDGTSITANGNYQIHIGGFYFTQ